MPRPVVTVPRDQMKRIRLVRQFHDLAGQALIGAVVVTGSATTRMGSSVVVEKATRLPLVDGVLDVMLPPDTYQLVGDFVSVDRVQSEYAETVTLGGPE